MKVSCIKFLQVDVNGQEVFMVDKEILAAFSGRIRSLFSKIVEDGKNLKVIFHDFPGGASVFELVLRFCYSNGIIKITPFNVVLLNFAAHFMRMGSNSLVSINLVEQTENFIEGLDYWTWSELLAALKQCQDFGFQSDLSRLLEKILYCLMGKLVMPIVSSPFTCFSENSSFQFSCDTNSICSMTTNACYCSTTWWFHDVLFMNIDLVDKVIRMMVSNNLDHALVFKFLVFYVKSQISRVKLDEKIKITETAIDLLPLLDKNSVPCKGLFDVLRILSSLKMIRKCHILVVEKLIGLQLDQATVDHLLLPCPQRKHQIYDVDLVLRLIRSFLVQGVMTPTKLKRLANLIDLYAMEVAPDLLLKPTKFAKLVLSLPDSARECCDKLYEAIDIYLEVHTQICEEDKMMICCAVNHEKLSTEVLKHLSQNSKFPSRTSISEFIARKTKLDSLISNQIIDIKIISNSPYFCPAVIDTNKPEQTKEVVITNKHEESLKSLNLEKQLEAMKWRANELEKVCRIMQRQISNATTPSNLCSQAVTRSLPRLCS